MGELYKKSVLTGILYGLFTAWLSAQTEGLTSVSRLRSGDIQWQSGAGQPAIEPANVRRQLGIAVFGSVPDAGLREDLRQAGVRLLEFVPDWSWYIAIEGAFDPKNWESRGLIAASQLKPEWKAEGNWWQNGTVPEWSRDIAQPANAVIQAYYPKGWDPANCREILQQKGIQIRTHYPTFQYFEISVNRAFIAKLFELPCFHWFEPLPPPAEGHNMPGRINHRSLALNMPGPGGRDLWGKGIIIGEWDGAGIGAHADYNDRMVNRQKFVAGANGNHATHVCGTITGGGIIDPFAQGMAPKARIYGWDFAGNIAAEMDTASWRDSIVMTNNSYGYSSDPCATRGTYDGISRNLDILVTMYPYLSHQFSSGNSRTNNCAPGGYRTINGGYQAAKNNITVGALTWNDGNSSFHSYGPMRDGRMKPEICGVGVNVYSTLPNNTYAGGWNGTSMSCPGVTGTIAQLYERFRQLNSNRNPLAHTVKAIVCNTGDDLGNTGPDYAFGFGRINALTALQVLERKWYKVDSVGNAGTWTDTIRFGAGTGLFKVMLTWDDVPAAVSASPSLVNDLDLELVDSFGNVFRPWTLDPSCHTCGATRKRDSLNNAEQFFIVNPTSGRWVVRVKGTRVTGAKEVFTVSWLPVSNFIRVTYPNGHESFIPPSSTTVTQTITWDAYGTTSTFTLEYSADSGATWNTITTGLANTNRFFTWGNAPAGLNTKKALVRVRNGSLSDKSDTTFTIYWRAAQPQAVVCDKQVHLFWARTPGAKAYRVLRSINSLMEPIAVTSDTFFTVTGLTNGQAYWFSLEAVGANNEIGPRCNGVSFTPSATPIPVSVATDPLGKTICEGNQLLLLSRANGSAPQTRQWQFSSDSGKTWQNIPGQISDTLRIPNFNWNQRGYQYRNQFSNICRSRAFTAPARINVDTPMVFLNRVRDSLLCEGDSIAWNIQVNSVTPPKLRWQRSTNNGLSWTDLAGDTLNRLTRRDVQYTEHRDRFRLLASNFCETDKASDTAILFVRPPLVVNAGRDTLICYGNSLNLNALGSGGDTVAYQFQWQGFPAGKTNQVSPTTRTVYRIALDDACTHYDAFDSIVVNVRAPLALSAGRDTTICQGRNTRLSATLNGGDASGYSYRWMPGNLSTSSILVSPGSTTVYTVTAWDKCTPDTFNLNLNVQVRPALNLNISRDTTICLGRSVQLNTIASGGLNTAYTVRWNQSLGTGSNKTVTPPARTVYRAILSDGCSVTEDTALVTVDVRPGLTLRLSRDTTICLGRPAAIQTFASGGLASGRVIKWNQGLSDGFLQVVSPNTNTTYRAVLSDGCSVRNDTQQVVVRVYDPLSVNTNNDTTLCYGNPIRLLTQSTGGNGTYTHRWENSASPVPALGTGNFLDLTPVSTMRVRVVLQDGCTVVPDTAYTFIRVLPNLSLRSSPDTAICAGQTARLRARTSGGNGRYNYTWTDLSTGNPIGSDSNAIVRPAGNTTYRVQVSDGCTNNQPTTNVQVNVVPMPVAGLIAPDTVSCDPGLFSLRNNSSAAVRYLLDKRRYSGMDTTLRLAAGTRDIALYAYNSLGCADTAGIRFVIHPTPKAGFTYTPTAPFEGQTVQFMDQSTGANTWEWQLPHGTFNSSNISPWTTKDSGVWALQQIVRNSEGCADTARGIIRVGIGYYLWVPTAFTPNGDGFNDVWKPEVRGARKYRVQVFNRWGQEVFSSDDPSKGWAPENPQEGVYAYTITLINAFEQRRTERGNITLLR
jgi:gliding motility-associated-like protein